MFNRDVIIETSHLDISIIILTIILPHVSIALYQLTGHYSSFSVYLSFLFKCTLLYKTYKLLIHNRGPNIVDISSLTDPA